MKDAMNIFEKILYGLKTVNDNIIVMNEKMDCLMKSLTWEETEPNDDSGADTEFTSIGDANEQHYA